MSAASMSGPEFLRVCALAADLILLALTGCHDLMTKERSVRAANLARARHIIRARLGDPDLKVSDIAVECGISLRYLHDLFRDYGHSVGDTLKSERLQRARTLLECTTDQQMPVTNVALSCGFSNVSHFSTAFRRAFNISPSEVLKRAATNHQANA
jgi:AraC-like DNA-binding protein